VPRRTPRPDDKALREKILREEEAAGRIARIQASAPSAKEALEEGHRGLVAVAEGLPGKPSPATYEYAARLLGLPSEACVVVEDAVSGVQAGRAGSFHSVIGVDRGAGRQTLLDAGATLVVNDLDELL
jgi:HAD superfamily hydrolase (TIGR01509 family)